MAPMRVITYTVTLLVTYEQFKILDQDDSPLRDALEEAGRLVDPKPLVQSS